MLVALVLNLLLLRAWKTKTFLCNTLQMCFSMPPHPFVPSWILARSLHSQSWAFTFPWPSLMGSKMSLNSIFKHGNLIDFYLIYFHLIFNDIIWIWFQLLKKKYIVQLICLLANLTWVKWNFLLYFLWITYLAIL